MQVDTSRWALLRDCLWEAGRDVCRDGTFFIPGLHENVSIGDNLQSQHKIVPAKRDGVFI